ncbi:uncharacterized protein METZ01_LOCUS19235 [marine metagenome]|uniref:Uncharacterized protein n=1 Tax=marine metagenome TaxID=408172 RepID=A0A381PH98_9ZZZZ
MSSIFILRITKAWRDIGEEGGNGTSGSETQQRE